MTLLVCLIEVIMKSIFNVVLTSAMVFSQAASADKPQWVEHKAPFDLKLNMEVIYDVTHAKPENLVATIQKYGVKIFVVDLNSINVPAEFSEVLSAPKNSKVADLPRATTEMLAELEWKPTYEGRAITEKLNCCNTGNRALVVRENVSDYTLIHEFMHTQLASADGKPIGGHELEHEFDTRALRKFNFYQRKLYDDPFELGNPLWRRDIQSAQKDFISNLYQRIRMGQVQEAIIEKTLSRYIDKSSPYYDEDRAKKGYKYGEAMINNAIDLFNSAHASIVYTRETVQNLLQEIKNGNMKAGKYSLTEADVAAFVKTADQLEAAIQPVKEEILATKAFYTK